MGAKEDKKDKKYRVEEGRKCQQDIVRRKDDCDQQSKHMQKIKNKMDASASKMRRRRQKRPKICKQRGKSRAISVVTQSADRKHAISRSADGSRV